MFLSQRHHQLREPLADTPCSRTRYRRNACGNPHQVRKLLLQKRQEDARRARLQEQRIRVDVAPAGFLGRAYQLVQRGGESVIPGITGAQMTPAAIPAGVSSSPLSSASRTRRARFENPRQFRVHRGHGHVHEQLVVLGHPRSTSTSRTTMSDLVTMPILSPRCSAISSKMLRVISKRFSAG